METNENFLLNLSILYRNIMKYFDHVLAKYDIGSGQIIFLTFIKFLADTLSVVEFPPNVPHPSVSDGIFVL